MTGTDPYGGSASTQFVISVGNTALRAFFNVAGFIAVVRKIQSQLRGYRVLVEPNAYRSGLVYVIAPAPPIAQAVSQDFRNDACALFDSR